LNALIANRPWLVDSRHDWCTALGPLVMATSGPVGVPSPKASAIGVGESSICQQAHFGYCHPAPKAQRAHGRNKPGKPRRTTMTEANKTVVRRLVAEVFNGGRLEVIDELYMPELAGVARRWIAPFRASFPDVTWSWWS
jgi:hypothetical protein